ncbi:MAG: serine/threonine protein kinase [Deltaproteobacteria bacterium]|nr:MAG: serine/threonine protein kinase [Deltaproteobacteria bacterium]
MTTPIGKYKLVRLIASGGMAEVYLARQAGAAGFEKLVCLKRILPHLARDRQFVEMFLNEARLAARLDHPNIVSIYDLGEANGNYFIAMEFIDGPSLRAVAKRARERGERLPIAEVVKIVSMAAAGLHYAHELADDGGKPLGLVHRDISPDNILVHRNGVAKVVDFGIAKAANSSGTTRTGALKGKVAYMPPEQLRGDPLDRRADVFALGVVLYEMLAGQRPWEGDSDVSLIGRIMTEEPKPFATVRLDAPPGLIAVLDRALAKDREARYSSCHDLQADLEALLVSLGKTITAARISDFAKAYEEPVSAPDESTGAAMQALEAEMNGTGPATAVPGRRPSAREPRTTVLPPSPPNRNGFAYAAIAFLCVAAIGGSGGYLVLQRGMLAPEPVPIERDAPRPAEPPAERAASQVEMAATVSAMTPPATDAGPSAPAVMAQGAPVAAPLAVPPPPAAPAAAPIPAPPPVTASAATPTPAPPPVAASAATPTPAPPARPTPTPEFAQVAVPKPKRSVPPSAPPPPVLAQGELVLLIRPWAKVEVDGHDVGVTPLSGPLMLAAGEHTVRLVNADLGKDITRTVRITASSKEVLKEILDE